MVKQGSLLRELQSIVGKEHAREPRDDSDHAVDGLPPRAIIEPGTYDEVADVLRLANSERLAVIPRGSGLFIHLGNIPQRYDVALQLTRLDKIIEHEPADLTLTCQAGITLGMLGSHLAQSGQMVPLALDSNPADSLTVGGLLALNSGDLRSSYGSPRDFTIGLKVITADGRITRAGGKVVKNVAGYDLCKLYIGSRGSLAVIADATFKVFPHPQLRETASFEFANCAEACRTAMEARARGLSVVDAHVVSPTVTRETGAKSPRYTLHLTLAGEPGTVKRSCAEARELADRARGQDVEWPPQSSKVTQSEGPQYAEHPLSIRAHLLPTQVANFIGAMESTDAGLFDSAPLLGEVTWIWLSSGNQKQRVDSARAAATRLGGTLEVRSCSPELKRQIDVFGPPPLSFPLMRAIKQQFDPNNVLSPGRFVGRL